MRPLPHAPSVGTSPIQQRLEAALILRGLIRVRTSAEEMEVEPRTWYRESGEHFLEARRRDSGEHVRIRVAEILEVRPY
jgi:hypothetical protein